MRDSFITLVVFAIYIRVGIEIRTIRRQIGSFKNRDASITSRHCELPNNKKSDIHATTEILSPASVVTAQHIMSNSHELCSFSIESEDENQPAQVTLASHDEPLHDLSTWTTNNAELAYFRCAFLFFIVFIITWVSYKLNIQDALYNLMAEP
jgi:hypothetical protein